MEGSLPPASLPPASLPPARLHDVSRHLASYLNLAELAACCSQLIDPQGVLPAAVVHAAGDAGANEGAGGIGGNSGMGGGNSGRQCSRSVDARRAACSWAQRWEGIVTPARAAEALRRLLDAHGLTELRPKNAMVQRCAHGEFTDHACHCRLGVPRAPIPTVTELASALAAIRKLRAVQEAITYVSRRRRPQLLLHHQVVQALEGSSPDLTWLDLT